MHNSAGTSFGKILYVHIKVVEDTSTITNTPLLTTEVTATPTTTPVAAETTALKSPTAIAPIETTTAQYLPVNLFSCNHG